MGTGFWKARISTASLTVLVAVMAAGVLAVTVSRAADAAFPGTNGEIAFYSDRDREPGDVFTISPDGGPAERITNFSTGGSLEPVWSPDGSRVAFRRGGQIWVIKANGTGAKQLTDTSTAKVEPAWSPDGTRIAYVANSFDVDEQTDLEIWAINADGSGRDQLTENTNPDGQPSWSPSGDKIAFVGSRPGDTDRNVYVMNADGTGEANITPAAPYNGLTYQGHDDHPNWSPDGSQIAYTHTFAANASGVPNVWVMDANGANKVNVQNNNSTSGVMPAWSPDGDRIAYVGATDTNRDIYVMDENGSNQYTIESEGNPAYDIAPDWRPASPTCDVSGNDNANTLTGTTADETICGLGGSDLIKGGGGNDILIGGDGNDMLEVSAGRATLDGGAGSDTASFAGSATSVDASLLEGFARRVGTDPLEGAALVGIERLTGSSHDDTLTGSNTANKLVGGEGADMLLGSGGKDRIDSQDQAKNDRVNGGPGTDTCATDRREVSIKSCE